MKKFFLSLLICTLMVTPISVFAQEEDEEVRLISAPVEEVTLPEKPEYNFDTFLDDLGVFFQDLQIFFTFDVDKKIEKRLEFAEDRFNTMNDAMLTEEDPAKLEQLRARYERQIQHALSLAYKHTVKQDEKLDMIEGIQERHLAVLNKVLEQVPQEAKPSIEKVITKTSAKYSADKATRNALKKTEKGNNGNSENNDEETQLEITVD